MAENNEKKRAGRRAIGGIIAGVMITTAFYIVMLTGYDLSWFKTYTSFVFGIYGFVAGGLTLTDVILKK